VLACRVSLVCLVSVLAASAQTKWTASFQPFTPSQRAKWFVNSTVGPESLTAGIFSAAISTGTNTPREYGPHWEGYGKRYGMRLTGISTSNAIEAGLGALWGEDPRYLRVPDQGLKGRIGNVMKMTFAAPRPEGGATLAYARCIAMPANNFLSNTWRAESEADVKHAALRTLYGFLGRMGSNALREFWPDLTRRVFRRPR
jgi:hypothetical protein